MIFQYLSMLCLNFVNVATLWMFGEDELVEELAEG